MATLVVLTPTFAIGAASWRRTITAWEVSIWVYLMLVYAYPSTLAGESWRRDDTLRLPGILLYPRVNRFMASTLAFAAVAGFPLLAVDCFQG